MFCLLSRSFSASAVYIRGRLYIHVYCKGVKVYGGFKKML